MNKKISLATIWLDGCSGCHMSFLDMDEKLTFVLDNFHILYSPLVDRKSFPEKVDVTIVEGAVSTQEDLHKILQIRQSTKILIALGDCAVTGNVPSLRNHFDAEKIVHETYGKKLTTNSEIGVPELISKTKPLNKYVDVDIYLPGCPPPSEAIFKALDSLLNNTTIKLTDFTRFGK